MNNDQDVVYYLSWKDQVFGPYDIDEIKRQLKSGKINSLYNVQSDGDWMLLRDFLAQYARQRKAEAAQADQSIAHSQVPVAVPIQESAVQHAPAGSEYEAMDKEVVTSWGGPAGNIVPQTPVGLAITAFVLSMFFFVPIFNGLTSLLTLIFGHLALSGMGCRPVGRAATLAWVGLWVSYVQMGLLAIGMIWGVLMEFPFMQDLFIILHGQMLGSVLVALIGSAILMLGVKAVTQELISYATCFVGALLPAAVSTISIFVLQANPVYMEYTLEKQLLLLLLVYLVLFIGQIFFWCKFIRLKNDEELGCNRATRVSLFYTLVFFFVGFGYGFLLTLLDIW